MRKLRNYLSRWSIRKDYFPTENWEADYRYDVSYLYRGHWVLATADHWWQIPGAFLLVWRNIE